MPTTCNRKTVRKTNGLTRHLMLSAATLGFGAVISTAAAQVVDEDQTVVLETVVVEAQNAEQDLQDVPISVTAFTAIDIERARISELQDYTLATPNVQATNFGNRSRSFLAIRGVTSFGGAVPYGIYVDGLNVVPGRLTRGLDQDLQDIERIEILRGPQGTYFGRNTMAGAINVTSVAPDYDAVSGSLTADVSSFDTYYGRGLINIPLSDTFALRAIAYGETSDGFIENVGSGPGNSSEAYGARVRLRGDLTDKLEMNLSVSANRNESDNFNVVPTGVFSPQLAPGIAQINGAIGAFNLPLPTLPTASDAELFPNTRDRVSNDLGVKSENESLIASARFDYRGDGFSVTSISGYVETNYDEFGEEDFTNLNLITNQEVNELSSFSQEIRADFNLSDRFDVIVGALYAKDETDSISDRAVVDGNPYNSLPAPFPQLLSPALIDSNRTFRDEVTSTAIFGEVIYTPSEQWELRIGGRFTSDEVDAASTNLLSVTPVAVNRSADFEAFTPRAALTYYPSEDVTLYAIISAGYKVGGFNFSSNPVVPEKFEEESAVNYEIGTKLDLFNSRARLNLSAFYFDWEDVQVQGFDLNAGTSFIQNAGKAHSTGIEVEFVTALTNELELTTSIGWLEAEFDEFDNAVNSRTGQIIADASGTSIPAAPEWNASASLLYERPITTAIDGFAQVDIRYTDDHFFSPLDENPVDAFTLVNLSLGFEASGFRVSAYADNLLDEEYFTGYKQGIHLNGDLIVVGEPPRYGLRISKSFN